MNDVKELKRLASPAPKPQSIAWDGKTLWMGSKQTKKIYAIDPVAWTVGWETTAPGTPWGMTVMGKELRVICGEPPDDNRFVRACIPGRGFDDKTRMPCPDDTGSHLSFDGKSLYVSQWYPKKVLELGADGKVGRVFAIPHEVVGQVYAEGCFYLVTTDNEATTDYWLTRVDPRPATPKIDDLARIPFAARGITFDGKNFWTNHREQNQMVCFARVD